MHSFAQCHYHSKMIEDIRGRHRHFHCEYICELVAGMESSSRNPTTLEPPICEGPIYRDV